MWRVLGRWLLYSFVGLLLVAMLFGGGGGIGSDEPKGSVRSISLSIVGSLAALTGASVLWAHETGGSLGAYWPGAAIAAWAACVFVVPAAWFSIAADIRAQTTAERVADESRERAEADEQARIDELVFGHQRVAKAQAKIAEKNEQMRGLLDEVRKRRRS